MKTSGLKKLRQRCHEIKIHHGDDGNACHLGTF